MNILLIGDEIRMNEAAAKLGSLNNSHIARCQINEVLSIGDLQQYELIMDLNFDGDTDSMARYASLKNRVIILNAVTSSLSHHYHAIVNSGSKFIGMNCLPTFISLNSAEVSITHTADETILNSVMSKLNWPYALVADRAGMASPRVICMIINEAYYTLQEGTASAQDIDLAMKLGTNYPFGPFEWANKIGIKNVYEVLDAMYRDTHEERYKICPLLRLDYLKA